MQQTKNLPSPTQSITIVNPSSHHSLALETLFDRDVQRRRQVHRHRKNVRCATYSELPNSSSNPVQSLLFHISPFSRASFPSLSRWRYVVAPRTSSSAPKKIDVQQTICSLNATQSSISSHISSHLALVSSRALRPSSLRACLIRSSLFAYRAEM